MDAEGRFLRVNQAICNIIGRSREELLGWRLFNSTHPDDRGEDEELYHAQVRGEFDFYSIEKRFSRGDDGRVVWCSIRSSTVRDEVGRFLYSVRVVQDITERKEAEERQRRLIDELNHRVKNTLATVQSLATQTMRGTALAGRVPRRVRGASDRAEPGARPAHAPPLEERRSRATSSPRPRRPICRAPTSRSPSKAIRSRSRRAPA